MLRLTRWLGNAIGHHSNSILDDALWRDACAGLPWVSALDATRCARLRVLSERFLREKAITPVGGLALDDLDRVRLAALCCLPLLEFGAEGLHGWSELIVYPDAFRVRRESIDDDDIQHEWEDDLIGEAWEEGPLILSWADVRADIDEPEAGLCVAVHEMAHKLDALDGAMDGTPPLPREWQREWAKDFQRDYDAFVAISRARRRHADRSVCRGIARRILRGLQRAPFQRAHICYATRCPRSLRICAGSTAIRPKAEGAP